MLKSYIKVFMRQSYHEMIRGDPDGQLSKQEWRMRFLERAAMDSKCHITAESCARLCGHVSVFYAKVLKYQDL